MRMSVGAIGLLVLTLMATDGVVSAGAQQALPTVRVRDLRRNPAAHVNEVRSIEGKVQRYVDTQRSTTRAFVLEDDYAGRIRVVTGDSLPARDKRVAVTGVVGRDSTGSLYIVARSVVRTDTVLAAAVPPPIRDADGDGVRDSVDRCLGSVTGTPVDSVGCAVVQQSSTRWVLWLLGIVALGALATVGILFGLRGRQNQTVSQPAEPSGVKAADAPSSAPTAPEAAEDGEAFDGKTIRFVRPPSGTLKMLPGRLEIVAGADKGQEIRFVKVGTTGGAEVTFGRNEGPPHTHIQLKAATVSRKHAVMRLEGGQWAVTNYSDTNPVVVNGKELGTDGGRCPLNDGDTMEMGEVTFKFHAR